ncbi:hypothetical protein Tco_0195528 [Tanacetum coccineum]
MTYLKHVGNFKHSELKSKKFEDIQAMYEKIKRSDEDFIAIGKRKHGTRKKIKSRKRRFKQDTSQDDPSDIEKENDELRLCLTIATDEDKEVDFEILDKKCPIIDWKTENLGTKPQFGESKRSKEIILNVVTREVMSNRVLQHMIRVLLVFDREALDAIYKLVMDIYQSKIPEGTIVMTMKTMASPTKVFYPRAKATDKEHQIRLMAGSLQKLQSQLRWIVGGKDVAELAEMMLTKLLKRKVAAKDG